MSRAIVTGHWNIPWLHGLPDRWKVVSSKRLFSTRKELARPDDEQLAATQAYGVISQKEYERRIGRRVVQITQNLEKRRHVERDDFIISMRSFEGGLERAWATGCIRSSYVVLKISEAVHPGFFQHLFKSHDYIQALRATSNFIRDGQDLNMSNFSLVDLPLPPKPEQMLLSRYLDWHGARTTKLIRAKKRLIALLNEQKQAIIHSALAHGYNPKAKLKPSGVPWLGEVPEHWEIQRIGRLARIVTGFAFKSEGFSESPEDVRLLRGINIAPGVVRWDSVVRWRAAEADAYAAYQLQLDDIVLGMDRPVIRTGIRIAKLCAEDLPSLLLQRVARIRPLANLDREFALMHLGGLGFANYLAPIFTGISVPHISPEQIGAFRITLPTLDEQKTIVRALKAQTSDIDNSISVIHREISFLHEFHARLISDVVTGKLDARVAAASLPETTALESADELGDEDEAEGDLDQLDTEALAA